MLDVIVCGGGPAGLAAAIACAMHGMSVVVLDCATPPIDKACGEGLLPEALAALEQLGVDTQAIPGFAFHGIAFLDGDSVPVSGRFRNGPALGVRRVHLHQALCRRAEQCGINAQWGTVINGLREFRDRVEVSTRRGSHSAKWCIGADGLQSQVRRWSGLDSRITAAVRIGSRKHYAVAPWSSFTEVYWGRTGQVYVTPTGPTEVSVASLCRDRISLDQAINQFPTLQQRLRGAVATTSPRGAVTLSRRLSRVTTSRIALLGDASGSVDAVTGAGLSLAFQQALAVSAALQRDDLSAYEVEHRRIRRSAALLSTLLLQLGNLPALRRIAFRSFRRNPLLFEAMLALHSGATPFSYLGANGALALGLQTLIS